MFFSLFLLLLFFLQFIESILFYCRAMLPQIISCLSYPATHPHNDWINNGTHMSSSNGETSSGSRPACLARVSLWVKKYFFSLFLSLLKSEGFCAMYMLSCHVFDFD